MMFYLPENRIYPSRQQAQKIANTVAFECFKGWQDAQYHRLHQILSHQGFAQYTQWEVLNSDEIDAYCFADKSRRKKTKKWQNPDVVLLLTYAGWRRLTQAQLVQQVLEQLQTRHSPSIMKEYRLALLVLQDIEFQRAFVPLWLVPFGMPSPFLSERDGLPLIWFVDND